MKGEEDVRSAISTILLNVTYGSVIPCFTDEIDKKDLSSEALFRI